ncbi:hypothetical protein Anas_09536 [Armadillidium nasatum]|uniref:Uncharacterized protein n=1 Tax=Armadillidium nasatum TaxID=96803 RepID=A0A5N5SJF4_9CRUS|nr:hypothetical protein Anas_09536 [Armadillidium nasatum]
MSEHYTVSFLMLFICYKYLRCNKRKLNVRSLSVQGPHLEDLIYSLYEIRQGHCEHIVLQKEINLTMVRVYYFIMKTLMEEKECLFEGQLSSRGMFVIPVMTFEVMDKYILFNLGNLNINGEKNHMII